MAGIQIKRSDRQKRGKVFSKTARGDFRRGKSESNPISTPAWHAVQKGRSERPAKKNISGR